MATQEKLVSADGLIARASESGEFGIFPVIAISYYPTDRIRDRISFALYNHEYAGFASTESYANLEREFKAKRTSPINPTRIALDNMGVTTLDADFTFYKQGSLSFGRLDVRRLFDEKNPQVNIALFSDRALFPYRHNIRDFGWGREQGGNVHIYTLDEDGSKWSIHCRGNPNGPAE